jgi:hypothetical protein
MMMATLEAKRFRRALTGRLFWATVQTIANRLAD